MPNTNPLDYPGYEEKIAQVQTKTHLEEAVRIGEAKIDGPACGVLGVCDARFLMGSMGHVVGEKITRSFERATEEKTSRDLILLFRRSQNAGRDHFPYADGKKLLRLLNVTARPVFFTFRC